MSYEGVSQLTKVIRLDNFHYWRQESHEDVALK